MRKSLAIGKVNWSYLDTETGDELWLTFHGYGQEAEVMHHFARTLRPNARIISFDLPLHGKTTVSGNAISNPDMEELISHITWKAGFSRCSIVAFSLGGKLLLKAIDLTPGKIERVLLVAPDGLRVNPIYHFATHTAIGRMLFMLMINNPAPLFGICSLLSSIGLMDKRIDSFLRAQMGTLEQRQKVYATWQMFRNMVPDLVEVRKKIFRYNIKPYLVFGTQDRVIHPKLAKKLSGPNCKTAEVIMLEAGHNLTTKAHALEIRDMIK